MPNGINTNAIARDDLLMAGGERIHCRLWIAIGNGPADTHFSGPIGDVIEVAGRVGRVVIDGGVNQRLFDGQRRDEELDAATGAERMTNHALGAVDR